MEDSELLMASALDDIIESSDYVSDSAPNLLSDISDNKIINVSNCLRLHSGNVLVNGTINSLSRLYKTIKAVRIYCNSGHFENKIAFPEPLNEHQINNNFLKKCKDCEDALLNIEYQYINAVTIEIQDSDTFNDIEKMSCILFDEDTKNIQLGSKVTISGKIKILSLQKNKKSIPYLFANSIIYENKEKLELTKKDIEAIIRFTKLKGDNIIDYLATKMFAPSIIGLDIIKKGILLSGASSGLDDNISNANDDRERIHSLVLGNPGNGKSKMIMEAIKLVPNSRYESSQHSSGKSLTAIVSKENESDYCLRLGPIPLARGSICVLNEVGRINEDDQSCLLDVMEEGMFTINKYGVNATINSPTVIIASANPVGSTFHYSKDEIEDEKINISQIPLIAPVIDRFDLVYVIKDLKNEKEIREYANKKLEKRKNKVPDYYPYLKKHVEYAKQFNPQLTEEAGLLISEYYVKYVASSNNNGLTSSEKSNPLFTSKRTLETIIRIAKTIAKLKLKDKVEISDAKEAIEFFNIVKYQFVSSTVIIPDDPKNMAISVIKDILKTTPSFSYSLEELAKIACEKNEYVKSYLLGGKQNQSDVILKIDRNSKLRAVYEKLIENPKIKKVNEKPITLQWIDNSTSTDSSMLSDTSDTSDIQKSKETENSEENNNNKKNDISYRSDESDRTNDLILSSNRENIAITPIIKRNLQSKYSVEFPLNISDIANRLYEGSDIWLCKMCNQRGDKWYMLQHNCKMNRK
jgi:replicative DNA helicase Mcm